MKIALPSKNSRIDNHFGHCEYFTVFTVNENNEIISEDTIDSPEGCGCKSDIAQRLSLMGVNIMLAGSMGEGAVNVLADNGIKVIRGCSGEIKTVIRNYLDGKLADSGIMCHEDHHACLSAHIHHHK
jgi:predicted Fe-Mo cluster-binding NifX family protein